MHTIKGYKDEWRIQEYLLLTFFISWLSWGILILLTALNIIKFQSVVGIALFIVGGFGPTLAALICIEGKLTWKKFRQFLFGDWKTGVKYFLLFAILVVLAFLLSSSQTNPNIPWYVLPIVFLSMTLIGGGNEELGWRGILQPVLSRTFAKKIKNSKLNFIATCLAVGVIWAVWHAPLWFVAGSMQQGISFFIFALEAILLAFWLGCIYQKSSSVFWCMCLHGLINTLEGFFVIELNWILVIGFIVITVLSILLSENKNPINVKLDSRSKE